MLQSEFSHTILEFNFAISSVDRDVTKCDFECKVFCLISCRIRYDCLLDIQSTLLTGIRNGCCRQCSADCSGLAFICRCEAIIRCFFDCVGNTCRQACDMLYTIMLQSEFSHTIRECDIAISAIDRGITKRDFEAEVFFQVVYRIRYDCLCDVQITQITGISELRFSQFGADRSFISGLASQPEACRFGFCDRVCDTCRQASRCCACTALQFDCCHTILERHISISFGNRFVTQSDCECEVNVFICSSVRNQLLRQFEITCCTRVCDSCSNLCGADCSGLAFICRCEAIIRCFFDCVGNTCRQACDALCAVVLQCEFGHTIRKFHITVSTVDCGVTKRDLECEVFCQVSRSIGYDCLFDIQIATFS